MRPSHPRDGGTELIESKDICVTLRVVTPILGGAPHLREIDDVDGVRVPTIRGHLRFWWRALHGHRFATARDLYAAEAALWGRATGHETTDGGSARSSVEVRVSVRFESLAQATEDTSELRPGSPHFYALWPTRATGGGSPASRRSPGITFELRLRTPADREADVRASVCAWVLFGGYGSRTRRGVGSLSVANGEASKWLPQHATAQAINELFGRDIFQAAVEPSSSLPLLAGAALYVGKRAQSDAEAAWTEALEWLREFRQGPKSGAANSAREPGSDSSRPGISNWPEADKVRQLSQPSRGLTWAHPPHHNATPAWPRAGFGLPIIGQFQKKDRKKQFWSDNGKTEPEAFELTWMDGSGTRDRLASPLIVKSLPLADGKFVPCALWFHRAYPNGKVVLKDRERRERSAVPFDRLVAEGDMPRFKALANKQSLRQAFFDWLRGKAIMVAP